MILSSDATELKKMIDFIKSENKNVLGMSLIFQAIETSYILKYGKMIGSDGLSNLPKEEHDQLISESIDHVISNVEAFKQELAKDGITDPFSVFEKCPID